MSPKYSAWPPILGWELDPVTTRGILDGLEISSRIPMKTRLAIIADIHGNIPALDAVLDDIAGQGIDETLVGGDLVGRGPQGAAVVRRVRALGLPTIGGNHEDYLLSFRAGDIPDPWRVDEEWAAARWMADELDEPDATFIATLPFSLKRPGMRLVHGTPVSNRDGIGPWTEDGEIDTHLGSIIEDVLVCAHTHRPLVRRTTRGTVINVGSTGLPFNRDQRAQYAIVERLAPDQPWTVELLQVPYDLTKIFDLYDTTGFLRHGGITARLLRLELEHATPLLVPFLAWAKATDLPPIGAQLEPFLAFRKLDEPLRVFYGRLKALASSRDSGANA